MAILSLWSSGRTGFKLQFLGLQFSREFCLGSFVGSSKLVTGSISTVKTGILSALLTVTLQS